MKIIILFLILAFNFSISQNCQLVVPSNPLSAAGLSTPYLLKSGCDQSNPDKSVFAEAVIINKKTGKLSIYAPLVINEGTTPLLLPKEIKLNPSDVVGIWFGSNDNVELIDNGNGSLNQGICISGLKSDQFGQIAACNALEFYIAANEAIKKKLLKVPPLGIGKNKKTCYTTRSFEVVDQDQSDNVDTTYIAVGTRIAQFSATNLAELKDQNPKIISNPSDNGLLNKFILPALGCNSFTAEDLVDPGAFRGAQALNEIQARLYQKRPVALVPAGNPMVLTNGVPNIAKLNAYRSIVNQPTVRNLKQASTSDYCSKLLTVGFVSIISDKKFTMSFKSPDPETADNLYSFLVLRFFSAFGPDGSDLGIEGNSQ
eukprot:gene10175-2595_t